MNPTEVPVVEAIRSQLQFCWLDWPHVNDVLWGEPGGVMVDSEAGCVELRQGSMVELRGIWEGHFIANTALNGFGLIGASLRL